MQNIDYSPRLRRSSSYNQMPEQTVVSEEATPTAPKLKTRTFSLIFVLMSMAFTAGIFAGFQLGRVKHIEESLVKYPDEKREIYKGRKVQADQAESLANIGASVNGEESRKGAFVIKVGEFDPDRADRIATSLNNTPSIAEIKPFLCKEIKETEPDRYLAFRTAVRSSEKQNVLVGCFLTQSEAMRALALVRESEVIGVSEARIFEIR